MIIGGLGNLNAGLIFRVCYRDTRIHLRINSLITTPRITRPLNKIFFAIFSPRTVNLSIHSVGEGHQEPVILPSTS